MSIIILVINSPCLHRIVFDTDFIPALPNLHDPLSQLNEKIRTTQGRVTVWKSKTLRRRHACELQTPDVDKIA